MKTNNKWNEWYHLFIKGVIHPTMQQGGWFSFWQWCRIAKRVRWCIAVTWESTSLEVTSQKMESLFFFSFSSYLYEIYLLPTKSTRCRGYPIEYSFNILLLKLAISGQSKCVTLTSAARLVSVASGTWLRTNRLSNMACSVCPRSRPGRTCSWVCQGRT